MAVTGYLFVTSVRAVLALFLAALSAPLTAASSANAYTTAGMKLTGVALEAQFYPATQLQTTARAEIGQKVTVDMPGGAGALTGTVARLADEGRLVALKTSMPSTLIFGSRGYIYEAPNRSVATDGVDIALRVKVGGASETYMFKNSRSRQAVYRLENYQEYREPASEGFGSGRSGRVAALNGCGRG